MANNLIPQELEQLIQEYLTDGVLTDKERQVILKKAEGMGLDRDEIDLYLDAQVQKIDQASDAAVRRQKSKSCPYCGGGIQLLTEKCPHCGEHITAQASEELQEIFDHLENALVDLKDVTDYKRNKAVVERYARKAKMYYGNNPKVQALLDEIEMESIEAEKRAKSAEKKKGIASFLSNRWSWVLIEVIVFTLMFFYYKISCSYYTKQYNELGHWTGTPAARTAYDNMNSAESSMIVVGFLGVLIVGATVYYATRKKE
ncbi:MAG: hypothetical protein IKH25_00745 [Muribaculaceae bacterium]|nr:hypothetical protein [Muribaculaceae bacterium]